MRRAALAAAVLVIGAAIAFSQLAAGRGPGHGAHGLEVDAAGKSRRMSHQASM